MYSLYIMVGVTNKPTINNICCTIFSKTNGMTLDTACILFIITYVVIHFRTMFHRFAECQEKQDKTEEREKKGKIYRTNIEGLCVGN